MSELLKIENLHVSVGDKELLHGINLTVEKGKVHVIMGVNGAGKSTLMHAIMGNPAYKITKGAFCLKGRILRSFQLINALNWESFYPSSHRWQWRALRWKTSSVLLKQQSAVSSRRSLRLKSC